jgi:hypothetical protein
MEILVKVIILSLVAEEEEEEEEENRINEVHRGIYIN